MQIIEQWRAMPPPPRKVQILLCIPGYVHVVLIRFSRTNNLPRRKIIIESKIRGSIIMKNMVLNITNYFVFQNIKQWKKVKFLPGSNCYYCLSDN